MRTSELLALLRDWNHYRIPTHSHYNADQHTGVIRRFRLELAFTPHKAVYWGQDVAFRDTAPNWKEEYVTMSTKQTSKEAIGEAAIVRAEAGNDGNNNTDASLDLYAAAFTRMCQAAEELTDCLDEKPDENGEYGAGYPVPYAVNDQLGTNVWYWNSRQTKAQKKVDGLVAAGRRIARRKQGEVEDTRLQEINVQLAQMQHQLDVFETYERAARACYLHMYGSEYGNRLDPKKVNDTDQTAAVLEFNAKSARMGTPDQRQERDGGPRLIQEPNGDVYERDDQGKFHKVDLDA
jgi:hypothetical protein